MLQIKIMKQKRPEPSKVTTANITNFSGRQAYAYRKKNKSGFKLNQDSN